MLIALDPGFGNTKVCVDGKVAVIQTAIAHPKDIGRAANGLRSGHVTTVEFADGTRYIVGPRAWLHGEPITSLDYDALASPERRALFYAAFMAARKLFGELVGDYPKSQLIVGLPVPLLQDRSQAEKSFEALRSFKGIHKFIVDGYSSRLEIERITVLAQPAGSYSNWLIDDDLHIRKGGKTAEAAVLDIGLNTLDLYAMRAGEVEPRFVDGAKVGVRRLLESLDGDLEMEESDSLLRAGRLRANTEQLTAWLNEILAVVERSWPRLARFSAVIPTGGGALILGDLLRNELARRGAAVAWPADPITANVVGLWKWYARRETKEMGDRVAAVDRVAVTTTQSAIKSDKPRIGRPPKSAPKCAQCGHGVAGVDGICTTCRNKAKMDRNASRTQRNIDRIVNRALANNNDDLEQAKAGKVLSASKVG